MLQLGLDIVFCDVFTNIEAAAQIAGVALLTDKLTGFLVLLILVEAFCRNDVQVAVFQTELNLVLVEPRQLDIDFIAVIALPHIRLHQVLRVVTIERFLHPGELAIHVIEPPIHQILTKNTRHVQHKSNLLLFSVLDAVQGCCYDICRKESWGNPEPLFRISSLLAGMLYHYY